MEKNKAILLTFFIILMIVGVGIIVYGIGFAGKETDTNKDKSSNKIEEEAKKEEESEDDDTQKPIATIEIKDFGTIKVELEPKIAPQTVANFIYLANSGFYDGLTIHRTVPEFVIQGGDKEGTGSGKSEYTIKGEFSRNGIKNSINHERGVISMARPDYGSGNEEYSYNAASTQFFITVEAIHSLNGLYASFGRVIEGMDVVDKIVDLEVVTRDPYSAEADRPVNPPVITSIKVETFGIDYGEPEKLHLEIGT